MRWLSVGVMALAVVACSSNPAVQEKPVTSTVMQSTPARPLVAAPAGSHRAAIGEFGLDLAAGRPEVLTMKAEA